MGTGKRAQQLYIIDFGLSKRYKDPKTDKHISHKKDRSLVGTVRYVSTFTHEGHEQSRRDDLQSIGFLIIYLLKGSLPWQGLKCKKRKEKQQMIADLKKKGVEESSVLNSQMSSSSILTM